MNSFRDFDMAGTAVRIDEVELDAIRKALLDKLSELIQAGHPDAEAYKALKLELSNNTPLVHKSMSDIGMWALPHLSRLCGGGVQPGL